MAEQQNYKNHARWYPLVHFIILPLLLANLIWAISSVVSDPQTIRFQYLLLSVIVVLINVAARLQPLKAQDRLIRLEERLRYKDVLSPELAERASALRTGQIIALRFASDEELPALVSQVLDGKLKTPKEIKMAVKNWRPDYLRV
ncbi:MAG: hypothetical protein KF685_07790 [Acidobacteria bacterium]|nr:hypothetical protein [Acidobacteriota bacterium]